jgi:phosphate transport system protein
MINTLYNPFNHQSIVRMGALLSTQVETALNSLNRPTKSDVVLALRREDEINALERDVIHQCEAALSMSAIGALTLSQRVSLARAAKDLERIGDEAKKIISKSLIVHGENFFPLNEIPPIVCIAHHASQSAARAIAMLGKLDALSAASIIDADLQIDAELDDVMAQVVEMIHLNPIAARSGIDVVFIAKAWERIGDHAKNLAENVLELAVQHGAKPSAIQNRPTLIWADEREAIDA